MESSAQSSQNGASHAALIAGLAHTSDGADKLRFSMSDSHKSPHSNIHHGLQQEFSSLHTDKATITKQQAAAAEGKRDTPMAASDTDNIDGILDITLHRARDIHNICIYGKQDVYAKFSITHIQDAVYSTPPVRGGGKNPVFNQSLQILIPKLGAVLRCELWMMSCARSYLEDQLLGFVQVPLGELMGMGESTRDYALSSTDLFHTPAGTVSLSLTFYHRGIELLPPPPLAAGASMGRSLAKLDARADAVAPSQTEMEAMEHGGLYQKGCHAVTMAVDDYNNIEFPDLQAASENQELVSMYMKMASEDHSNMEEDPPRNSAENRHQGDYAKVDVCARPGAPSVGDYEMALNHEGDDAHMGRSESASANGDGMSGDMELSSASDNKGYPRGTTTPAPPQEVSGMQLKDLGTLGCNANSSQAITSPRSVSSSGGLSSSDENKTVGSSDGQESVSSFLAPPPLVSLSLNPEVPAVIQQDIVDMYMKSMQQFTESLAKMKLPFDMDAGKNGVDVTNEEEPEKKGNTLMEKGGATMEPANGAAKDGYKVFYGSRAFF